MKIISHLEIFNTTLSHPLLFPVFIAIAFFLRTPDPDVFAQNREATVLAPVVVSATRTETARQDVAANIEVITREEIEKLPVSSVSDILKYISGVFVEVTGGPGSFTGGVRVQGSEVRHVAVYRDGVPLNQLDNPVTDLSYLSVDAIERIEVYKGAASSAWGSALGGVVNIITRNPESGKLFSGDARASYGEYGTFKTRGGVNGVSGRFGYLFTYAREESDGFIDHTHYDRSALYAKFHYDVGETGRLNFIASYDEGKNGDPLPIFPSFWDDIDRERFYQKLSLEVEPTAGWVLNVEGRHHRWDILIEDVFSNFRAVYNDYNDETWGGSATLASPKIAGHQFNVGFDGNRGTYDWINYDRTYDSDNWAVYANDTVQVGALTFNAGLRFDDADIFGSEVSPAGGAVFRFWEEKAAFRFQAAKGFSAPPASWVHDPVYGNPDLKAETAVNYQLGAEVRPVPAVTIKGNVFLADVDHLIRFNMDTWKWENLDEVVRKGVEGAVKVQFPFDVAFSFGASYVDVRDDRTDEVIEDIPRTQMTVQLFHRYRSFSHSLTGTYTDYNSSYPETKDCVFIFDYAFKLKLPAGNLPVQPIFYGAVYNLFDTEHLYREVWPFPPRWAEAGIRFTF